MDTKEFEKKYNGFQEGKRKGVSATKWYSISSVVIIISVLVWAFGIHTSTIGKIIVTNDGGRKLESEVVNRENLLETLIKNHCEMTSYYINSFDRLNIKEHQAKSLFYVNTKDANKIFDAYQSNGGYKDAIQLGYSYKAEFERIISFNKEKLPYQVEFSAILSINELGEVKKYKILCQGEIDTTTPQYPENKFGFFFKEYKQVYKRIENE